jgi:ATP synthase protein I
MAEDDTNEVPKLAPDARLESLDERLDQVRKRDVEKANNAQRGARDGAGRLIANQLVGGPLGGAIVGWLLDRYFGTAPWLLLILMFVGFVGGFINVMRISNKPPGNRDGRD